MKKILFVFVMFLIGFAAVAKADEDPPPIMCVTTTAYSCNSTNIPGTYLDDVLTTLYTRPIILHDWRMLASSGSSSDYFVQADGTVSTDSFMSGVVMPESGIATVLRVRQPGAADVLYTLQVNGVDTDLSLDLSLNATDEVLSTYAVFSAGDVLTLKTNDDSLGGVSNTYITVGGYFY